jgi:hypothetical protein
MMIRAYQNIHPSEQINKYIKEASVKTVKKFFSFIVLLCVVVSSMINPLSISDAYALGMEVDPVEINLKNIPLGETIAVSALSEEKMKLTIQNKSPIPYTYTIDIIPVAETGGIVKGGYADIPDTSWIQPEEKEVLIPANSTKEVELFVMIPDNDAYKAKSFQAVVDIKSRKNSPQDVFVVAVQINIYLGVRS